MAPTSNNNVGEDDRRFKVIVTLPSFATDQIEKIARVLKFPNEGDLREWVLKEIVDADVIYTVGGGAFLANKEILDAGKHLKAVVTISVGYDNIDVQECKRKNIRVGYAGDVSSLTEATAEFTMALLLATDRQIPIGIAKAKTAWDHVKWGIFDMCGQGLNNSVVGFFGMGRIGESVARKIEPYRPKKIIYNNRSPKTIHKTDVLYEFVSFEDLLAQSDFLIINASLNKETEKIFNKDVFKKMKSNAVLINVGR